MCQNSLPSGVGRSLGAKIFCNYINGVFTATKLPSVLWHCWLGARRQEGHSACKKWGWWRWAVVSLDRVVPSWMVCVSVFVNLPLHHKVQKLSSGSGSPGWSRKKGQKTVVVVVWAGSWVCHMPTLLSQITKYHVAASQNQCYYISNPVFLASSHHFCIVFI